MSEKFTKHPQEAQTEELLLLDLFLQLRKAGLLLGIDEYKLLQQALQAGFGTDLASLKLLCQTIWVKSYKDKRLYDDYFRQAVLNLDGQLSSNQSSTKHQTSNPITESTTKATSADDKHQQTMLPTAGEISESADDKYQQTRSSTTSETSKSADGKSNQTSSPNHQERETYYSTDSSELIWSSLDLGSTLKIEDEVKVAQSLSLNAEDDEIYDSSFNLTSEYFPVTGRQMKQSWRYLRLPVREGPPAELDLEATVNQVGYKGMLLELVLAPRRVNRAELLLLLDQDGSMTPFHLLSRQLSETLLRGGRLGKASIYYFHNCPTTYLYRDCHRQKSEPREHILHSLRSERSSILIFSDAGAARGGYSQERVQLTKKFLDILRNKGLYVAWLNPMPRKSWKGTTAERIDQIVPMFEFSRRGLQDAIGVLRRRPTNFEGRTI